MEEERMQILKMLEDGQISAEDAARLLDAVGETASSQAGADRGKRLRIRITDAETNKQTVNLSIPLGLAKLAVKFIPHKAKEKMLKEGVDVDSVLSQVLSENIGKMIDIQSDDGNVELSIE